MKRLASADNLAVTPFLEVARRTAVNRFCSRRSATLEVWAGRDGLFAFLPGFTSFALEIAGLSAFAARSGAFGSPDDLAAGLEARDCGRFKDYFFNASNSSGHMR